MGGNSIDEAYLFNKPLTKDLLLLVNLVPMMETFLEIRVAVITLLQNSSRAVIP
jgi:hypothetical protein